MGNLATYRYRAIGPDGTALKGVVEAADENEAAAKAKQLTGGYIDMITRTRAGSLNIDLNEPLTISEKELALACSQFSILLKAGLPLMRTVEIVAAQSTDKALKKIFTQVAADVGAGFSLAQSFETRGKKLPVAFIETVRAGEASGTLEGSFQRLNVYFTKSSKIKGKVKGAMMYPALLLGMSVVVIGIVLNVMVPVFEPMFEGRELPLPTQILMDLADYFKNYWYVPLGIVLLLVVALKLFHDTATGQRIFALAALRIPILGKINVMNGASQFANTMCTLLSAGMAMTQSMEITGRVIKNKLMGRSVADAVEAVKAGRQVGDAMHDDPYFPPLLVEMTAVGEESGSLEATLTTIGEYYDYEVETATAAALAKLEPIITIFLGVLIAFILIALYAPMFGMYDTIG